MVNTVISKGPIIFLTLNQSSYGEIDAFWWNPGFDGARSGNVDSICINDAYVNYTQFTELYGDKFNIAPRYHKCDTLIVDHWEYIYL